MTKYYQGTSVRGNFYRRLPWYSMAALGSGLITGIVNPPPPPLMFVVYIYSTIAGALGHFCPVCCTSDGVLLPAKCEVENGASGGYTGA